MLMGSTVMKKPREGDGKGGGAIRDSAPFMLPLRCLGTVKWRWTCESSACLHVSAGSSAPRPVSTSQVPAGG